MATQVGTGYVDIRGDFSALNKQIDAALAPLSAKFGKLGKAAAVGLTVGVGAAAVSAGAALYAIGSNFDDAYDKIRVGTGQTGKALKGLEADFKTVVKSVPTDFGNAAGAITTLNQRLGLTGKPLQQLSERVLELSRMTGTDLAGNIDATTKAFNRWKIGVGQQSPTLDKLFRAFQQTGVPVAKLADELARFATPLQAFGFNFNQSAALLGAFGKAGLNTSKIMMSLNIGLANVAKTGQDPRAVLAGTIEQIKQAGTASEANAAAIKLFGARSGPELAAAIRSGRLELGQLTAQIAGGKDTILGASADTQDFAEKWQIFRNRVLVDIAPLAERVFNAVGAAMDKLPAIVDGVAGALSALAAPIISVADAFLHSETAMLAAAGAAAAVIAPFAAMAVASVAAAAVNALRTALLYLRSPLLAITLILEGNIFTLAIAAVAALTAGFIVAYRESSRFRSMINGLAGAVANAAVAVWEQAKSVGAAIVNGVLSGVASLYALLKNSIEVQLVKTLTSLSPFSPVEHGGEKYIGRPLGEGAIKGWVYGSADLPATMSDTIRAAVEKARKSVEDLRTKFTDAFGSLADDALSAFDAVMAKLKTPTEITLDTAAFNRQVKDLAAGVNDAKAKLTDAKSSLDALSPTELASRLEPLQQALADSQAKAAKFTAEQLAKDLAPLNRKLADAKAAQAKLTRKTGTTAFDATLKTYVTTGGETDSEFAQRQADAAQAVTDAQDAITKANDDFTQGQKDSAAEVIKAQKAITKAQVDFGKERVDAAKAVAAAVKAVDDAEQSQRDFYLGLKAKKERKELDADIALRRRHFVTRLDALKTSLSREGATQSEANSRIKKLLRSFGVDYQASGDALGTSFVTGLKETQSAAVRAAAELAASTRRLLTPVPVKAADVKTPKGAKGPAGIEPFATGDIPKVKTPDAKPITDAGKKIGDAFAAAGDKVKAFGRDIADLLKGPIAAIRSAIQSAGQYSEPIIAAAVAFWHRFGGIITGAIKDQVAAVAGVLAGVATALGGIVTFVAGVFTADWSTAWAGVTAIFTGIWGTMVAIVTGAWELVKTIVATATTAIGATMSAAWDVIKPAASSAWDWVKNAILTPVRAARELLGNEILPGISNRLDTAWNAVKGAATAAWDAVKTAVVTPVRAARELLGNEILPGIGSRLDGAWGAIKGAASTAWDAVKAAVLAPIRAARDALDSGENILGGMLNRIETGFGAIVKGVKGFAGDIKDGISDAFRGAAVAVLGFMGKIAGAVNVVLKVIGVPQIDVKKFELAQGGTIAATAGGALTVDQYATGGQVHRGTKLTAPIIMMGEEAPRHPEFVIPTNPAYRKRAVGLYDQLGAELGVQQFAKGGILGGPIASAAGLLDTIKSIPGKLLGEVTGLIGPLPGVGDLPGWLKGLGRFILGKVGGFVEDKLSGLLSLGLDFGGDRPDPDQLASITAMVKRMDEINAHHWDYKYGGGHASFEGPYDCSGLVSAILHAGGLLGSPITTDGLKVFGEGGDGKVITIGVRGSTGRNAHTMMKLGNRYLESGGTNGGAKWVSGWDGDFPIHRHPVGFAQGGIIDQLGLTDPESPLFAGWGLKHGGTIPFVGSYKDGGVLPADGLYLGHKGETVVPNGAGTDVTVEVNFRDDRLRDLIDVQVTENDRRKSARFFAGARA